MAQGYAGSGQSITVTGLFSGGNSNLGNTAGDTGVVTGRLVLVGTNNISLSGSTNGGSMTISISGAAGGGGGSLNLSAGTTSNNLTAVTFSNSNGVSFGLNASTVTASIATSLTNIRVSAGTTSNLLSALTFSNSNGLSFGLDASTITGSYSVPVVSNAIQSVGSATGSGTNTSRFAADDHVHAGVFSVGVSTGGNTSGDTRVDVGRFVLQGGNNVTLSQITAANALNTIVISGPNAAGAQTGISGIQVSDTTYTSGTVTFRNANGISFGSSGAQGVSASYTVPVVSNAIQSVGSATGSGTNTSRFAADDHVHAGVFSVGVSTGGNTVGDTRVDVGRFVLQGGNNITLSQITAANALNTIVISGPNAAGAQTGISGIQVSDTTYTSGTVTFRNANGISFGSSGANGVSASYTVPSTAGLISAVNISAGTTSNNLSAVTFSNSNNVSFGLNGSTVTATVTVATSLTNIRVSAGTTSNLLSALTFADSNGLAFGINASTITGSYTVPTLTSWTVSDSATSATVGRLAFTASNGLTLTLSTSNNGNHTVIGSYTRPVVSNAIQSVGSATGSGTNTSRFAADDHVHAGVFSVGVSNVGNTSGDTRVDVGRFVLAGGNNITLSQGTAANALNTITISAAAQTNQTGGIYVTAQSTGQSSSSTYDLRTLSIVPDGIISAGWSNGSFRISATQSNQAFSAAGGSSAFQTLGFSDNAAASFTNTNGSVAIASVRASLFATSNTTQSTSGTANLNSLIFAGAGIASVGVTNGSVVVSVPSGGGGGDGGVFAGVSTAGNTAGSTGTVSTGNFVLVGSNNITLSQSTGAAGSAATVTVLGPDALSVGISTMGNTAGTTGLFTERYVFVGSRGITLSQSTDAGGSATLSILGDPVFSSYSNIPFINTQTQGWTGTGTSVGQAFVLPNDISFSFLRVPVSISNFSTTVATLASATATAQMGFTESYNAGIYSVGTGASSRSLMSVMSTSASSVGTGRISITNSTQGSYSLAYTGLVEGDTFTLSTQYSISNTNYSFSSALATAISGLRFLDVPWNTSLAAGVYWLFMGRNGASSSAGAAGLSAMTNWNCRYAVHYVVSGPNSNWGVMNSTNLTTGGLLGAGSMTTNTSNVMVTALPMSNISSSASNPQLHFQLLRSA